MTKNTLFSLLWVFKFLNTCAALLAFGGQEPVCYFSISLFCSILSSPQPRMYFFVWVCVFACQIPHWEALSGVWPLTLILEVSEVSVERTSISELEDEKKRRLKQSIGEDGGGKIKGEWFSGKDNCGYVTVLLSTETQVKLE